MYVVDGTIALRSRKIWWVFHETWRRRHQMEPLSALLGLYEGNSPVTSQRPVTRSFHVFFDLHLNKLPSKRSRCWWFKTPTHSLWRHYIKKHRNQWICNVHAEASYFETGVIHYTDVIMGTLPSQNHQPHDCLLNGLFTRRSKKISKLRVTVLCVGNSPETGEFPAQMASNAENVSIWWRHHEITKHWIIIRHV